MIEDGPATPARAANPSPLLPATPRAVSLLYLLGGVPHGKRPALRLLSLCLVAFQAVANVLWVQRFLAKAVHMVRADRESLLEAAHEVSGIFTGIGSLLHLFVALVHSPLLARGRCHRLDDWDDEAAARLRFSSSLTAISWFVLAMLVVGLNAWLPIEVCDGVPMSAIYVVQFGGPRIATMSLLLIACERLRSELRSFVGQVRQGTRPDAVRDMYLALEEGVLRFNRSWGWHLLALTLLDSAAVLAGFVWDFRNHVAMLWLLVPMLSVSTQLYPLAGYNREVAVHARDLALESSSQLEGALFATSLLNARRNELQMGVMPIRVGMMQSAVATCVSTVLAKVLVALLKGG